MADNPDKITSFDKAHYDQLISYLSSIDNDMNTNPKYLAPGADLKLDNSVSTRFHPGSTDWSIANDFISHAGSFATSVHNRMAKFDTDMRSFMLALKNAIGVFEKTNDLNNYDASSFGKDYPDFTSGGGNQGGA